MPPIRHAVGDSEQCCHNRTLPYRAGHLPQHTKQQEHGDDMQMTLVAWWPPGSNHIVGNQACAKESLVDASCARVG